MYWLKVGTFRVGKLYAISWGLCGDLCQESIHTPL